MSPVCQTGHVSPSTPASKLPGRRRRESAYDGHRRLPGAGLWLRLPGFEKHQGREGTNVTLEPGVERCSLDLEKSKSYPQSCKASSPLPFPSSCPRSADFPTPLNTARPHPRAPAATPHKPAATSAGTLAPPRVAPGLPPRPRLPAAGTAPARRGQRGAGRSQSGGRGGAGPHFRRPG